ncbi:hypothetical protein GCM10027084_12040 [Pseudoxanthomonas sangjuensis]
MAPLSGPGRPRDDFPHSDFPHATAAPTPANLPASPDNATPMRKLAPFAVLFCLCATARAGDAADAPAAKEHRPEVSSHQCGLSTPYNVLADTGGIWLYRDEGAPKEIFFHGGELSVDHRVQQVSAADAQRLRLMETEARALMPQVAGLARDVVDITYDALGGVVDVLTGSWLNARKIERKRKEALAYVDTTLGKGRWDQDAFGGNFEKYVEREAEDFKGSIARHLLWQIATGRADAMEARADRVGDELDAKLDARSEAIEAKADALCAQVRRLDELQQALEYRFGGQPLRLIETSGKDEGAELAAAAGSGG